MTECCLKAVGEICFAARLRETGKCCLCQKPEAKSDFFDTSHGVKWEDYKFRFVGWDDDDDSPPSLPKAPKVSVVSAGEDKETDLVNLSKPSDTINSVDDRSKSYSIEELKRLSADFRLPKPLPEELVPYLSQDEASRQFRKSVEYMQSEESEDDKRKSYSVEELKRQSGDFRPHTPLLEGLIPRPSQDEARREYRKSAEYTRCEASGPSIHSMRKPSLKSRIWGNWRERLS